MVRMVINHESAVTDGRGETWLPYVLQDADGRITRLGVIRREALGDCHGDGGAPSGTTRHELPIGE